jgi:hypothetical protein
LKARESVVASEKPTAAVVGPIAVALVPPRPEHRVLAGVRFAKHWRPSEIELVN